MTLELVMVRCQWASRRVVSRNQGVIWRLMIDIYATFLAHTLVVGQSKFSPTNGFAFKTARSSNVIKMATKTSAVSTSWADERTVTETSKELMKMGGPSDKISKSQMIPRWPRHYRQAERSERLTVLRKLSACDFSRQWHFSFVVRMTATR